jgi:SAM-dependent methyltransferase
MRPVEGDASNGYEAVASEFMAARERSNVGVATVRAWGRSLPKGAAVLELGCGSGVPISEALMNDGVVLYGVDASRSLTAAFRSRFPNAPVACEAVEDSRFFDRTFDGVLAVGLMFLLPAHAQRDLIRRVALALTRGGRFLFSSPAQSCSWTDMLTERPSLSLGAAAYKAVLSDAGLRLIGEHLDEGENHYYDACKQ